MNRTDILDAARQAITVDRAATHGEAENTFGLIAAYWSVLFGIDIHAAQVAQAMVLFKVARMKANPRHADNYVDAVGYAAIAGELADPVPTEWTDAMVEAMVDQRAKTVNGEIGGLPDGQFLDDPKLRGAPTIKTMVVDAPVNRAAQPVGGQFQGEVYIPHGDACRCYPCRILAARNGNCDV